MSARSLRARFSRAVLAVLLACLGLAGVPAAVAAQEAPEQQAGAGDDVETRIVAQRLDDDRVEFALQLRVPGEPWSERALPALRFFPPETEIGRWLVSSSLVLRREGAAGEATEVELRIAAQRVEGERIEFALQQRGPGESWGERVLPARRFFGMGTEVGRWLVSSTLTVTIAAATADPEPPDAAGGSEEPPVDETTTGGPDEQPGAVQVSEDVLDFDMIDVRTGETVNIRSVVNGETPLLFWLWSPY